MIMLPFVASIGLLAAGAGPTSKSAAEFSVVATIHKGHLLRPDYPLGTLCRLLSAYRPDLVLVEVRSEPFKLGHFEDGPFEMTSVIACAVSRGIAVEPIDWWREEDLSAPEPSVSPSEQKAFEAESAPLEELGWPSFTDANSSPARQRALRFVNAQARYLAGNAVWTRRQAWFNHQALEAISRKKSHRAMLFVGFNHAPELEAYLRSFGLDARAPTAIDSNDRTKDNEQAADSVVQKWSEGLGRLRLEGAKASGEAARRIEAKIRYFEVAVERKGRCCVPTSALEP